MILSSIALTILACAIKRPPSEVCVMDAADSKGICITKQHKDIDREFSEMNNYICRPLEDNGAMETWISELQKQAAKCN